MNKYEKPFIEILTLDGEDIITASPDQEIYQDPNETEIMTPNP